MKEGLFMFLMASVCLTFLFGCSKKDDMADLKQAVAHVKKVAVKKQNSSPKFKPAQDVSYSAADIKSPFTKYKNPAHQKRSGGPRSPLEKFPLSKLNFIGTIENGDLLQAVISTPDGKVFEVRKGSHVGLQSGKVIKVTPGIVEIAITDEDGGQQIETIHLNKQSKT